MVKHSIVVVGSVNLDIVANVEKLPIAGETVTGSQLNRYPGGKGANQALAAKRLGVDVSLIACVGNDSYADEALTLLRRDGVDLSSCCKKNGEDTGIALISVAADGENQIVVVAGANRQLLPENVNPPNADALICQLEVPTAALMKASASFKGFFCANLAPARTVPEELIQGADLIVVNQTEAAFYADALNQYSGLLAITYGAKGAELRKNNQLMATAKPPAVDAIDATAAGDTFTTALTLAIIEGQALEQALQFACAAGAAAATKHGAQSSIPTRNEVEGLL